MRKFTSVKDVADIHKIVGDAIELKEKPLLDSKLGIGKTLGIIFMNPSLRSRISTQKAAMNLGLNTIVINMEKDCWALETRDNVIMDEIAGEHIKEAAAVLGEYCDIIAVRDLPKMKSRDDDYSENFLKKLIEYSDVPVISLECGTLHPLQSLADLITIEENKRIKKPKVVLTWAPHIKPLPQAVPNSFSEWMCRAQREGLLDFVITHPKGLELKSEFTEGATIDYDQNHALSDADFVYVKSWSSYSDYGENFSNGGDWFFDNQKLKFTNDAYVMHCLPVRRGVDIADEILDGPNSLVIKEAGNRVYAAQIILKEILGKL
ncbi:Rossmann-fold NAD(P)-binding domain-containing protein [Pedobacter roseus]|uniref:N-succinylornithine carbamoyltransferase n=1 Tax=Pedobacter roseus TaxID=336820 RepID=A0A7G9QKR1_9SPHI|nr:acetylornithine carbamoyltransferase [Pedobacter roseus]QNN43936.1 acetylornithine carbamoyltransferase [Pedobacter roseus]